MLHEAEAGGIYEFKANLGYIVNVYLKGKHQNSNKEKVFLAGVREV